MIIIPDKEEMVYGQFNFLAANVLNFVLKKYKRNNKGKQFQEIIQGISIKMIKNLD